jgi:hypothetical protein
MITSRLQLLVTSGLLSLTLVPPSMFSVSRWVFDRLAEWLLALPPFLSYPRLGWPSVLSARCVLVVCVDALMTATLAIIYRANLARHLIFLPFPTPW